MLAEVAASSLNDSVYFALVLSHREDFVWIFLASLATTAAALPWIMRGERERRTRLAARRGHSAPAHWRRHRLSGTNAGSDQALDLRAVEPENPRQDGA